MRPEFNDRSHLTFDGLEIGRGSTFVVSIDPGTIEGVEFVTPIVVAVPTVEIADHVELDGQFLIVDDRRNIQFLAKHIIEQAGGTVIEASNGQEGVDAVQAAMGNGKALTAILTDMKMPIMDGYTAVAELRRRGVELPNIAMTANAMKEDRDRCLAAGCSDFISKPVDKNELLRMIHRLVH